MSNKILDNAQRLNIQGKIFNVNTKMSNIELSVKNKLKMITTPLLFKQLKNTEPNKSNTHCYIAESKNKSVYSCSNFRLKTDDPEVVSDKFIPSLALFLSDKYGVENSDEVKFFIYTFVDRPSINESDRDYYGIIVVNNISLEDKIVETIDEVATFIDLNVDAFGLSNYSIYELEVLDKKTNILPSFPHYITEKYPDLKFIPKLEDLNSDDIDYSVYYPTSIKGGFSLTQTAISITMGLLIYGAHYYIDNYKDDTHTAIIEGQLLAPLAIQEDYLLNFKAKEAKDGAEKKIIYEQGKSEFIASYYSNLYSTAEIHENFNVIRSLFPDYLAEWQLSKIVFDSRSSLQSNQMFFVVFDRIRGSIGVYDELDRRIEAISAKTGIKIEPKELIKQEDKATGFNGESRVYMVDFNYDQKLDLYKKSLVSMNFLDERDKQIVELSKQANMTKANIYGLMRNAREIKKEQLIFGETHLKIATAINFQVDVLKSQYDKIINLTKIPLKSIPIPENTNFDEYKYISLKQRDSLFEWNYPSLKTIYPNPQKIKKDKLAVFAKEFSFILKSDKKISLGYTFFLEAIERLNIDPIQLRFAEYDVKNQTYFIEGRFFEQLDMIP